MSDVTKQAAPIANATWKLKLQKCQEFPQVLPPPSTSVSRTVYEIRRTDGFNIIIVKWWCVLRIFLPHLQLHRPLVRKASHQNHERNGKFPKVATSSHTCTSPSATCTSCAIFKMESTQTCGEKAWRENTTNAIYSSDFRRPPLVAASIDAILQSLRMSENLP